MINEDVKNRVADQLTEITPLWDSTVGARQRFAKEYNENPMETLFSMQRSMEELKREVKELKKEKQRTLLEKIIPWIKN